MRDSGRVEIFGESIVSVQNFAVDLTGVESIYIKDMQAYIVCVSRIELISSDEMSGDL